MLFLVCTIENQEYAIDLQYVIRSFLALEVTPLPHAPPSILGVFNLHGEIVTIINLRDLLELPSRDVDLSDQFILCKNEGKLVALWVDDVKAVKNFDNQKQTADIKSETNFVTSIVDKEDDKIIHIFDLQKILLITNKLEMKK